MSAYPRAVTAQMVKNFLSGGAAISVLARLQGIELWIIDAGVDGDCGSHPRLIERQDTPRHARLHGRSRDERGGMPRRRSKRGRDLVE